MNSFRVWLATAVVLSGQCLPAVAADWATAITELRQWEQQFVGLRVKTRVSSTAEINPDLAADGIRASRRDEDWAWEDSGRFREYYTLYHDEQFVLQSLRVADLKRYFDVSFPSNDPTSAVAAIAAVYENSIRTTASRGMSPPWLALWDGMTRTWLARRLAQHEQLQQPTVSDDGLLALSGDAIGMPGWTVWLDPAHSYLPARAEHPDATNGVFRYLVDEFSQPEPGFWFPKRGSMLSGGVYQQTWEVQEVLLNPEFTDEFFTPPIADRTLIRNTLTGKEYYQGGQPPVAVRQEHAATQTQGDSPATAEPDRTTTHFAQPESPHPSVRWLALAGMILILTGLWLRRRR